MDSGIIDEVTEWDSAPAGAGFDGLRGLAEQDFSGAVTADGMTWAFVLNGNVVGVFDGPIETFEGADLSAYAAPDPALPLLFAMQEQGGETRAKYYTNDTPLSEADRTLSSGNFTGYVELSENVLSGDYYVVYYGGKSMSVAFVGNSGRLISGDEAFEKANGEVGIYEVKEASIDVVEIPEPATGTAADGPTADESDTDHDVGGAAGDGDAETDVDGDTGSVTIDSATDDQEGTDSTTGAESDTDAAGAPREADEATAGASAEPTAADERAAAPTATDENESAGGTDQRAETTPADVETGASVVEADDAVDSSTDAPRREEVEPPSTSEHDGAKANGDAPGDDVFSEEERWREAQEIPALDPDESSESTSEAAVKRTKRAQRGTRTPSSQQPANRSDQSSDRQSSRRRSAQPTEGVDPETIKELKRKLKGARQAKEKLETERDELAAERDRLAAERDEVASERDEYEAEVERLRETVSELESELEAMEQRLDEAGVTTAERTMSPSAALEGTNLFVRYHSKSDGTLEDAHGGDASREEVNENLRLEHHTTFESEGVTVEGRPFVEYLHDTVEFGFVRWAVRSLLYEIIETGNRNGLDRLYDVIPKIDRAELQGQVSLSFTEDGEEVRQQQTFDVVLRNRMGNPLIAANLNDSRTEATENMMTGLIESASRLRESSESFGAAFLVTSSFFDPGALEAAADATSGGLLSRSKRKSFVKVSRKRGYHLCLVEARNGEFHVNVPEL